MFYLQQDKEYKGPFSASELLLRKIKPTDLIRYGEEGPWKHFGSLIATNPKARAELEDSVDPDQPEPEGWQKREMLEYTWPVMLMAADSFFMLRAAASNNTTSGWLTVLSLLLIIAITIVAMLKRLPWAWLQSALLFVAMSFWLLAPLIQQPGWGIGLWYFFNLLSALFLILRRPRGPALHYPQHIRRLLILYSENPKKESIPLRFSHKSPGPALALFAMVLFFFVVFSAISLYHLYRFPNIDLPLSLVPRGGDIWGKAVALAVYGVMLIIALLFSVKNKSAIAALKMTPGLGWKHTLWTGFRVFLLLFVVLLTSSWFIRTVEVIEHRIRGPQITSIDETTSGQVRHAVRNALEKKQYSPTFSLQTIWFILITLFIGPICEEIFFRGFLFGAFRRKWPFWLAACLSSIIFATSHGWGSSWESAWPIFWAQIAAGGFAAAYAYELTGTLTGPIAMHILWNSSQAFNQFAFN